MKKYLYFFTRQDISAEQQLVQSAHVAFKIGYQIRTNEVDRECNSSEPLELDAYVDPNETYFVVIGVRDGDALISIMKILDAFKFQYEMFREPDIDNQITSVATYPIDEDKRSPLDAFSLLKITKI